MVELVAADLIQPVGGGDIARRASMLGVARVHDVDLV